MSRHRWERSQNRRQARRKPRLMPMKRYPLTSEQKTQLEEDLKEVEDRLQDIIVLMRAAYGEGSQPAIRGEETAAALQRLKWELERIEQGKAQTTATLPTTS
jgi:hypothetical protein